MDVIYKVAGVELSQQTKPRLHPLGLVSLVLDHHAEVSASFLPGVSLTLVLQLITGWYRTGPSGFKQLVMLLQALW